MSKNIPGYVKVIVTIVDNTVAEIADRVGTDNLILGVVLKILEERE